MHHLPAFRSLPLLASLLSTSVTPLVSHAAQVVVHVSGLADAVSQIGCSLFASPAGFPMDGSAARQIWLPANPDGVTCTFSDLQEGRYAVAVAHDLNGKKNVDTNFVGMPTEAWGVSGNARPTLRAPKWDEAVFSVNRDRITLEVRIAK